MLGDKQEHIQNKAKEMLKMFSSDTRDNGDKYVFLKRIAPQWMHTVCAKAHDKSLPDDYTYEFIKESLFAIVDQYGDLEDTEMEASIYIRDLLNWLASNLNRINYMDDANDAGPFKHFIDHLMTAQSLEKNEVLQLVIAALEEVE